MPGKKGRFEKKLAREQAGRAPATILRATRLLEGSGGGIASIGGTFRVHVRVEPVGEPAFEASLTMHVTSLSLEPRVGEQIPVIHHEGSVAWDSDAAGHAARKLEIETDPQRRPVSESS